jgi:hypothetical protein
VASARHSWNSASKSSRSPGAAARAGGQEDLVDHHSARAVGHGGIVALLDGDDDVEAPVGVEPLETSEVRELLYVHSVAPVLASRATMPLLALDPAFRETFL